MKLADADISLTPAAVARVLASIAALLIIASIAGQIAQFGFGHDYVKGLVPLFNLDHEQNIPNYYSVLLMHVAATLLAGIAVSARSAGNVHAVKWAALALGFVVMGYDEAFQVHESLIVPIRRMLGNGELGFLYFAWVIPGVALVFALFLFFRRFLLSLPTPTRRRFLLAAVVYLGGALGMELIGGSYAEARGQSTWGYNVFATIEETLEMGGVIYFIWALLKHFAYHGAEVHIRFREVPTMSPVEQAL